jgi:hypothetical protein
MKNLKKVILASTLLITSLSAYDKFGDITESSLIGVEIGGGRISTERTDASSSSVKFKTTDKALAHFGLKLGAENEHYRVLLSGRYAKDTGNLFDYIMSYEVEGDYLFNVSRYANIFLGIHAGATYLKFTLNGEPYSRTISSGYYGGNVGVNFHATRTMDIELGTRFSLLDASNIKNKVKYEVDDTLSAYCSIIFKYQMD